MTSPPQPGPTWAAPASSPHYPVVRPPVAQPQRQRPPLQRNTTEAWLGGVAGGIARHLGWPLWLLRVCFVALTLTSFLGVAVYGALWVLMPVAPAGQLPPGLEAASHQGMRDDQRKRRAGNIGRVTAVLMLGVGIIMLAQQIGLGLGGAVFWPALLAMVGIALVWLQADAPDEPQARTKVRSRFARAVLGGRRRSAVLRIASGMLLVGAAIAMLAASRIGVDQIPIVLWVAGLTLTGVGVVAAPWVLRYRRNLDRAREEKLIADTRADMAAHLHDSVLQTLALIQRQAHDPRQVASLARRQERELRTWLYADTSGPTTLKAALIEAGGEVEDERGIPVEVVCVGDIELTANLRAMVHAAREAMINAAKHSQADTIDVYAEVEPTDDDRQLVQVFVRDRGRGFNLSDIGDDRMGVRGSIIGRMARHGGAAKIRSAPGEGTEIRLEMTL